MNTLPHHVDVLIVGAGPTGLALALALRRTGINACVVDKLACLQNTSRAAVLHAHTLDMLDDLGVTSRMLDEGLRIASFGLHDRDHKLARLNFDTLPSQHNCLLMLPQDRTEQILYDALCEAGGAVHWQTQCIDLQQVDQAVRVMVSTPHGIETVSASYVVGADGMHSRVRDVAGIGFGGHAYAESFILADVEIEWALGREEVRLFFAPEGMLVIAPLPNGWYRMVATLDQAPAEPGVADMQALLDARGPANRAGRVTNVHWSSRFRLHHRVADHYRAGRLLLVGDAAHVHSPAGGQGMNTGIVDALLLARMLAEVLAGRSTPDYLDQYETIRRPAALEVLALSARLTRASTLKSAPARVLRNLLFRLIGYTPALRHRIEMSFSGLSRRSAAVLPADHHCATGTTGLGCTSARQLATQDGH